MQWYVPRRHVCIEPHGAYCERLSAAGYEVVQRTAFEALRDMNAQAIYLLDVIEHMEKDEAAQVLKLALEHASIQVVVYTPLGFVEQHEDAWGLGGEVWQTHRSGWTPEEFPGWEIEPFMREGFFAVYDK